MKLVRYEVCMAEQEMHKSFSWKLFWEETTSDVENTFERIILEWFMEK
jgi:hypothetical protein